MTPFLSDDWLLTTPTARALYHGGVADLPIVDFHNHLSPQELAENKTYAHLTEAWLAHDHYKWRAMRACGASEELVTGNADPFDKFKAFARAMPRLVGSPLHAWAHLELRRFFGIPLVLSEATAREIYDEANRQLPALPIRAMLDRCRVAAVGTTDDPADPLPHHAACDRLFRAGETRIRVAPTFRPDKAHNALGQPKVWNAWAGQLGATTGVAVTSAESLLAALAKARVDFSCLGAKASDHGLASLPDAAPDMAKADRAVRAVLGGAVPDAADAAALTATVLTAVAQWNHAEDWVMQLHLGPRRNTSPRLFQLAGPDAGGDVMDDAPQVAGLSRFLGTLDGLSRQPKTILYNLNPYHDAAFATLAGVFQGNGAVGHTQWGVPWWFNDHEPGIRRWTETLAAIGVLGTSVGMLTDSRSPLSMVRHEYFRRILCDMLGSWAESGRIPADREALGRLAADIAFHNAADYFGFGLHPDHSPSQP